MARNNLQKHLLGIERLDGISFVNFEMSGVTEEDMWNSTCNYCGAESTYMESNTDRYVSMVREEGILYTGNYPSWFVDHTPSWHTCWW